MSTRTLPLRGAANPSSLRDGTNPGSFANAPNLGGALSFSSPDTPGMPQPSEEQQRAMAGLTPEQRQQAIRGMVDGLAAKLADAPGDRDGWLRLASARRVLGEPDKAAEAYMHWLPLINYENRQCGLAAAKILMEEGGVIKSGALRHPLQPVHPAIRAGLIETARRLDPLVLRWSTRRPTLPFRISGRRHHT